MTILRTIKIANFGYRIKLTDSYKIVLFIVSCLLVGLEPLQASPEPKGALRKNSILVDELSTAKGQLRNQQLLAQQPSVPLPGSSQVYQSTGDGPATKKGLSPQLSSLGSCTINQFLPISESEAKIRIDELKTLILVARPQDLQGRIYSLCEWLADLTDRHNRLANAFSREESCKAAAYAEHSAAQQFSQFKNEAILLKAQLLISLNRVPEAIAPLVDIVLADPKGATGQAAYKILKDLHFAPEAQDIPHTAQAKIDVPDHVISASASPRPAGKKSSARPRY